MTKSILFKLLLFIALVISQSSCKKFLDETPNKNVATPNSVKDLELMLNNYFNLNSRYPSAAEVSADNYYLTDVLWAGATEANRNFYLWQKFDNVLGEWSTSYQALYYPNLILELLPKMETKTNDINLVKRIKGSAYFLRAIHHYTLAQLYCQTYDKETASKELGIPLKVSTDINELISRSTIKVCYDLIVQDFILAASLLEDLPSSKHLPSKAAAFGALSRTFLTMQDFGKAKMYADSSLSLYNSLIDYNIINASAAIPFQQFNDEVIYDAMTTPPSALGVSRAKIDTTLFSSYHINDLRRSVFFRANADGSMAFKGYYNGQNTGALFTGIATDEIYLTRAECNARKGDLVEAMKDLNYLLKNRWRKINGVSLYTDQTASSSEAALQIILQERRKELLFRNLRWTDLRRLNKEERWKTTLYRKINNQVYQLLPNSNAYALQIDYRTIILTGIPQNP